MLKKWVSRHRLLYRWGHSLKAVGVGFRALTRRRRGAGDHLKSTLSLATGSSVIRGRPINITIEPTNVCNLGCPVCETGAGLLNREKGNMTYAQFQTIIDKIYAHTNTLMFYFMGEPFLNRDAYRMIRYAKDRGIPFVTTCTNGDVVDPARLVDCGLDEVSFQMGGATPDTHAVYRIGSHLDRVLNNLRETVRWRNEKKTSLKIVAGFILMKHNEHQVDDFKKMMTDIGADETVVIDPCVRTIEQGHRYLPTDKAHWYYDPVAFARGELKPKNVPPNECPWIYYSMAVLVDGRVVPCCRDPRGDEGVGNLLEQTLDDVWNGERFRAFRERLHRNQGQIDICRLCSGYGVSKIV